jgi:glycosyltransferase involved in cell wall biosynthesis
MALANHPEVEASWLNVPSPRLLRRLIGAQIPGLAHADLDLQPLRVQLALSAYVRSAIAKERNFDVLHAYTQNTMLLSTELLASVPSIVSTDASGEQSAPLLPYRAPTRWTTSRVRLARHWEDRVYKAATFVVAESQWAADSLSERYGVEPEKLRVITFGIAVRDRAPRVKTDPPEITFIGSTMERKGGTRLLNAFRAGLQGRCVLNLVTRDKVRPEPGVRVFRDFSPGDPRLTNLLARTAVFAFPSDMDTRGYAVLEAMGMGVPVVAMPTGAISEIVVHGETGLIVEHDDEALRAALAELLDDEARRESMGEAGRARVEQHFDAAVTTERLLELFEEAYRLRTPR